ncbi:hypothetical protein [Phenylobacterium sp.]|uniref:hypothetical protein n=1 Tax=Phenylobacterium sp. TaxID=1871053 RepID=UPI002F42A304
MSVSLGHDKPERRHKWWDTMDATQQNLLVLFALLGAAGVFAVFVALLSSQTLRHENLRTMVKRWLK